MLKLLGKREKMRINELLEIGIEKLKTSQIKEPISIARRIMCFVLKKDKIYLVTNGNEEVEQSTKTEFLEAISKIQKHIPIQYITKKQEFMKMDFYVDENVLIPQPDTEIVVEEAIDIINRNKLSKVLDMCTGSGILAISIAKYTDASKITAVDISEKALEVAEKNAISNDVNTKIKFIKSDMFKNISEKFDLIISNPPYIRTDVIKTLSEEVKNEPILALDGGIKGLDFYNIIAENAKKYLNENGYLVLEIGYDQKTEVVNLLEAQEYSEIRVIKDMGGNDRVIVCKNLIKK